MNELEQIFIEMLDNIDDHKQVYDKPEWTNKAIVKTWVKSHEEQLKKLLIHNENIRIDESNVFSVGDDVMLGNKKAKVTWTSVRYVDLQLMSGKIHQGVRVTDVKRL